MQNISMTKKGDILTITIDTSKTFGVSKSGKSIIVASTEGNKPVPEADKMYIGVNVYTIR
jgi:hypothetical protein